MLIKTKINNKNIIKQIIITFGLNVTSTLLSVFIKHIGYTEVPIVLTYILSVLITSRYTNGYIYGIVASVLSMMSFNFYFTEPIYTFKVEESTYIFTFIVMLFSAIFTSTLTSKLMQSNEMANEREKQAHILYNITSSLAKTSEVSDVALVSAKSLSNLLECNVSCIIFNIEDNSLQMLTVEFGNREVIYIDIKFDEIETY